MGILNALLYGSKYQFEREDSLNLIFITLGIFYAGLILFAIEGAVCIFMAAPIGFIFFLLGHFIGKELVKKPPKNQHNIRGILIALIISVPCMMGFDTLNNTEEVRSVVTRTEINASPEIVWQHVINFPALEKPQEWIFKAGIAYPMSATIDGKGVGAVRHCNFSTGSFTEPITEWKEPTLLKFNVTGQPAPMKELSPYNIHPNHLHGYWVSEKGQFKLTGLPNGHTLLEGTTWYINKLKPDWYWSLWSDFIVHKIHQRVLNHIKTLAEKN